jgi:transposase InsO family protein
MLGWAEERKINLIHIQPGRPMQNGHVESFHGRLRDEVSVRFWPYRQLVFSVSRLPCERYGWS